jgi:hypothetical protein
MHGTTGRRGGRWGSGGGVVSALFGGVAEAGRLWRLTGGRGIVRWAEEPLGAWHSYNVQRREAAIERKLIHCLLALHDAYHSY